ncbi:MAG: hypothetical protein MJ069_09525 [Salinivirgaceae bacterium]|nr:hypothetical protein [Salinivirgaceae bacterium]
MKTKTTLLTLIAATMCCVASAQVNDSTTISETTLNVNGSEYSITDDGNEGFNIRFDKHTAHVSYNDHHWQLSNSNSWTSLSFGMNTYGNSIFSTNLNDESSDYTLNTSRSFNIKWMVNEECIPLGKHFGIETGFGFDWNRFRFDNQNSVMTKTTEHKLKINTTDTIYDKSKMCITYLVVPVKVSYQIGHFMTQVGVEGMLKTGSKNKLVELNGNTHKNKNDFYLNTFRCNLIAQIYYNDFGVFFSQSLTPLFQDNKGAELYPMAAGVSFKF